MSILSGIIIEISLAQMGLAFAVCVILAFLGKSKYSLIAIMGAMIYWVFFLNEQKFGFSEDAGVMHTLLFIVSSLFFVLVSAWVIFLENR